MNTGATFYSSGQFYSVQCESLTFFSSVNLLPGRVIGSGEREFGRLVGDGEIYK